MAAVGGQEAHRVSVAVSGVFIAGGLIATVSRCSSVHKPETYRLYRSTICNFGSNNPTMQQSNHKDGGKMDQNCSSRLIFSVKKTTF